MFEASSPNPFLCELSGRIKGNKNVQTKGIFALIVRFSWSVSELTS